MTIPFVLILLLGFSICMVVGLVTALQDLVKQSSLTNLSRGSIISDQSAEP
jgi:hypothetical protein